MAEKTHGELVTIEKRFRFWDNEVGEMFYFDLTEIDYDGYINHRQSTGHRTYIDNCVVMQYTGLKDKNRKEIYEGDIVKTVSCMCGKDCAIVNEVLIVQWLNNGFSPFNDKMESENHTSSANKVVIGNIYENSELLENI